jgi:hypothetical protein
MAFGSRCSWTCRRFSLCSLVIDAVTSLAIVWFLIKEGREAWTGDECFDHG